MIDTLEKLKDYEYIEEWAYELATLYEASGETKKCIHECDEIVLWFGHGEYVDKAIALKCKLTGEPLPEISTVEQHRVEEEQRAAHEKQLTESIGAEMGIEGFAGADYEGSIDLDLIQRAMDGAAPEAADEPIVETAVTEDTLQDEVIVEEPVLEENEEPTLEENEESAGSAEGEETQDAAMAVDAGNTDSETVNADGNTADDDGHAESADEDSEAEQPDEENEKSHIAHLFSSLMFGRKEKEKHFDWSTLKLAKEKGKSLTRSNWLLQRSLPPRARRVRQARRMKIFSFMRKCLLRKCQRIRWQRMHRRKKCRISRRSRRCSDFYRGTQRGGCRFLRRTDWVKILLRIIHTQPGQ